MCGRTPDPQALLENIFLVGCTRVVSSSVAWVTERSVWRPINHWSRRPSRAWTPPTRGHKFIPLDPIHLFSFFFVLFLLLRPFAHIVVSYPIFAIQQYSPVICHTNSSMSCYLHSIPCQISRYSIITLVSLLPYFYISSVAPLTS